MPYEFVPLSSHHGRATFSCGEASLDAYIRQYARQDMKRNLAVCYVLCEPQNPAIIGYYTLSAFAIEVQQLARDVAKSAGSYQRIPAILLGRLAVDTKYQGQGMGAHLLLDVLWRSLQIPIGIKVIVVDALHEKAANFYEQYGFRLFLDAPLRLYLPMAQVRQLFPDKTSDAPP